MKTRFASKALILTLCVSIIYTPTHGFAQAPPTQTGGGGGQPPSTPPPPVYMGGGGLNGDPGRPPSRQQLFDIYQIDPARNPIYFEGLAETSVDANGKEIRHPRVFQFLEVSSSRVGQHIRRGTLIPDTHYIDSPRVEWSPYQYTLGELMMEVAAEKSKTFRRSLQIRGVVTSSAKPAFELYLVATDGFDVYFEGKKDGQGRERVFRRTLNSAFIDRGVIENFERGSVLWTEKNVPREKALAEITDVILKEAPRGIQQALAEREGRPRVTDPRAGRTYPQYPEVPGSKEPLPRNRSLVITDGVITDGSPYQRGNAIPSGSGVPEVSSPYRATLEPFSEQYGETWRQGRPSNLTNALDWSDLKGHRLKKAVQQYLEGSGVQRAATAAGRATTDLASTSVSFYLAMGLMAGYELAMSYSDNPRAWTAFLETGTDPVFYLSMGTFMAVSEPFFRKMGPMSGPAGTVLPYFTGAIVVGGIASHLVSQVLNDPNFRKCYGFTSYSTTGQFTRDLAACDKLYDRFANYQLDNELLPLIANLSASSTFFYTSLRALSLLGDSTRLRTALGAVVRVLKIPPSTFARGDVRTIGMMALFLGIYEFNSSYLRIGDRVNDMFLKYNPDIQYPLRASYDFLVRGQIKSYINEFGNSLDDGEKRVLKEWKRIHEGKFKNPYVWNKVCLDTKRNYQLFYNCDQPDQFDFDGVIKRYSELQSGWREAKMKPTMDVYGAWARKVEAYNGTIAMSYVFYKTLIKMKSDALKRGQKEFTLTVDQIKELRTRMANMTTNIKPDYQTAWTYVVPRDFFDFIVTSAVCGPEAEPFGKTGRLGTAYQWLYGTSPRLMAADSIWSDIQFFPPRIVQALPGNVNICDKPYEGLSLPNPLDIIPGINTRGRFTPETFPYTKNGPNETWGQALSGSGYARGLDKYLMANFRDSILDENGNDRFDDWWIQNVINPQMVLQQQFRNEYEKMLTTRFVPALQDKSYTWCEANSDSLKVPSLQKHLRTLGKTADCTTDATHRLAVGIFNSLQDELRLYSALILDLHESVSGKPNQDLQDTLLATGELLEDMQNYLTTIKKGDRANIGELQKRFGEIREVLKIHHGKLTEGKTPEWKAANAHISLWTSTLEDQLEKVIFQAAEYAKVLINFEIAPPMKMQ